MKILMVCLGNICRSPLAEGIMASKLADLNGDFIVDSAGTYGGHAGQPPDPRSIAVAHRNGINISNQCARLITMEDFKKFDLIFTMDQEVQRDVKRMTENPEHQAKIHLLRTFAGQEDAVVPDPYYDKPEAFESVYRLIDTACTKIASDLEAGKGKKATGKQ
jgi:protein-tyrosine phosphatase